MKITKNAEQVLIYNNFIKYEVLKGLTRSAFESSPAASSDNLNIYIDMYKMTMDLYEAGLEIKNMNVIVSCVINLCAHYRSYYWNNHHVSTKFFIVYSDISCVYNETFYPGYNIANQIKESNDPRIKEFITYNTGLLETLCPYLPDIYFIKGVYEPSVIILDLIYKEEATGNMAPNLVITRDNIAMQLPAYHPNTTIFLNSKRTGEAYFSNKNCAISAYLYKTGRKKLLTNEASLKRIQTISPELLSLLIALSNLPSRCVQSIYDINKAINIIGSAVARGSILNCYSADPVFLYRGMFVASECKISEESFAFRFKAIDLLSMYNEYLFTPYAKDLSYKIDLDDGNTVRAINDEYFRENPLDLNRL